MTKEQRVQLENMEELVHAQELVHDKQMAALVASKAKTERELSKVRSTLSLRTQALHRMVATKEQLVNVLAEVALNASLDANGYWIPSRLISQARAVLKELTGYTDGWLYQDITTGEAATKEEPDA